MAQNTDDGRPTESPQFYSSSKVDRILWQLLDEKREGFYVDIGAGNGVTESPSCFFEKLGWSGICVEPNPQAYLQCLRGRPKSRVIHAAMSRRGVWKVGNFTVVLGAEEVSFLEPVPANLARVKRIGKRTMQIPVPILFMDLLLEYHTGSIDFVSLDVVGSELDVLDGFSLSRYHPTILVATYNSDEQEALITDYMARHSYVYSARVGPYGFYLEPELYKSQTVFT